MKVCRESVGLSRKDQWDFSLFGGLIYNQWTRARAQAAQARCRRGAMQFPKLSPAIARWV